MLEARKKVEAELKEYPMLKRKETILEYESQHPQHVTEHEVIGALALSHSVQEMAAAINGERTVPYFIFHSGDMARLAYATNEFLYYEDSNGMPLMFRTDDGTLVSDNEFADMGLYESEENVENGTEQILPFTDYCSDEESACDLEDEEDMEL